KTGNDGKNYEFLRTLRDLRSRDGGLGPYAVRRGYQARTASAGDMNPENHNTTDLATTLAQDGGNNVNTKPGKKNYKISKMFSRLWKSSLFGRSRGGRADKDVVAKVGSTTSAALATETSCARGTVDASCSENAGRRRQVLAGPCPPPWGQDATAARGLFAKEDDAPPSESLPGGRRTFTTRRGDQTMDCSDSSSSEVVDDDEFEMLQGVSKIITFADLILVRPASYSSQVVGGAGGKT
ncbi:unnamed protein product, partial [Amoebophrya sp. A120]